MNGDGWVRGDYLGLDMPAHTDALRDGGPRFLTEAFRATGALASDGTVTRHHRTRGVPRRQHRAQGAAVGRLRRRRPADRSLRQVLPRFRRRRPRPRTHADGVRGPLRSAVPDAGVSDRGAELPVRRLPRAVGDRAADHRSNSLRRQGHRAALRQVHGLRDARPRRTLSGPARCPRPARGHPQSRSSARRTRRALPG